MLSMWCNEHPGRVLIILVPLLTATAEVLGKATALDLLSERLSKFRQPQLPRHRPMNLLQFIFLRGNKARESWQKGGA